MIGHVYVAPYSSRTTRSLRLAVCKVDYCRMLSACEHSAGLFSGLCSARQPPHVLRQTAPTCTDTRQQLTGTLVVLQTRLPSKWLLNASSS